MLKHGDLVKIKSLQELEKIAYKKDESFLYLDVKFDLNSMSFLCNKEFYIAKVGRSYNKQLKTITIFSVYDYDYMGADNFILSEDMIDVLI